MSLRNLSVRQIERLGPAQKLQFAQAVVRGLNDTPRNIDCRYLYDAHGSQIFEHICEQPEYYLTRTEAGILTTAVSDIIDSTDEVTIVEFGSGSSIKTQIILKAYAEHFGSVCYTPVDISKTILNQAELDLAAKHPDVKVDAFHGSYDEAFKLFGPLSPVMFLFLGSTIGNLDTAESGRFWENVSVHLNQGDFCLLGIDINEDADSLHAAYNDAAGFSTAFTRNVFERMNRELGSTLETAVISHVARYDPNWRRVEIFAEFQEKQRIEIALLGKTLEVKAGERILTEISRKFKINRMVPYLATFGLETIKTYVDPDNRFAVLLLEQTGDVPQ